MSGQLVGEVLNARQAGDLSDLNQADLLALLTIADGCYTADRRGPVPMIRVAASLGKTLRTAKRTVKRLRDRGLVRVVKRGYKSHGSGHASVYELAVLGTSKVSPASKSAQDTQDVPCTGDVLGTFHDMQGTFHDVQGTNQGGAGDIHGCPPNGTLDGSGNGTLDAGASFSIDQLFSAATRPSSLPPPEPEVIDAEMVSDDDDPGECDICGDCGAELGPDGICPRCYPLVAGPLCDEECCTKAATIGSKCGRHAARQAARGRGAS